MATPDRTHFLPVEKVQSLVAEGFQRSGLHASDAILVAKQIVGAEADGLRSHGINRVIETFALIKAGKVKGNPTPRMARPRSGFILIDADQGFPHAPLLSALDEVKHATLTNGIAAIGVHNAFACGVLGYFAEQYAAAGLAVLAFTNAPASIAPSGGSKPVFGTNPIACAIPRDGQWPLVIDQSSSVVAKSAIVDKSKSGEPIPIGWALDENGRSTTSAADALKGSMAPSGGYKGVGLAMIVEVFAALLTGANMGIEAPKLLDTSSPPPGVGQFLIAIDPTLAGGAPFGSRVEKLLLAISNQPGARVAGAKRLLNRRKSLQDGIPVTPEWLAELSGAP